MNPLRGGKVGARHPCEKSEWKPAVPSHWQDFYEATNVPAAVHTGSELRVTGHTGELDDGSMSADPETQIRQASQIRRSVTNPGSCSSLPRGRACSLGP
jgi:hypothetical protein